jgi:hypothetical protein
MGIFVPSATLPSGITVSNVYMSFTNEVLYVMQSPDTSSGLYQMTSYCNVFPSRESVKQGVQSNIRFNVTTQVSNVICGYQALYNKLKNMYPSALDVIEPRQVTPMSNLTFSIDTLQSIFNDLATPPTANTGNLVMTTDMASQFSNLIQSFTFPPAPAPEPEEKIETTE